MSKALRSCRVAVNALSRPSGSSASAVRLVPRLTTHHPRRTFSSSTPSRNDYQQQSTSSIASHSNSDSARIVKHLENVFSPLQFPPELANRIMTHASHKDAIISHNARLSFIGRRVLKTYLLLYIHSSPALLPAHDYDLIIERALNTYVLGQHVAPKWGLGRVLKWAPVNISPKLESVGDDYSRMDPKLSHSVGLYKVMGTSVEAVVGGIFYQYGGAVAHRLFHTRILPNILLPGRPDGLHDSFHAHAMEICEQMGGVDGPLLVDSSSKHQATPRTKETRRQKAISS